MTRVPLASRLRMMSTFKAWIDLYMVCFDSTDQPEELYVQFAAWQASCPVGTVVCVHCKVPPFGDEQHSSWLSCSAFTVHTVAPNGLGKSFLPPMLSTSQTE